MNQVDQKNIELINTAIKHIKDFVDFENTKEALIAFEPEIAHPTFWDNTEKATKIMKDKDRLENLIQPVTYLETKLQELIDFLEIAEIENDRVILEEIEKELESLVHESFKVQIESILSEEHDSANSFLEINAGAGGTEAQDWAEMLARMYARWAEKKGYKIEITDKNDGDEAGVKSITLLIKGKKAYGWLKKETGVHRLVRISPYDSNARRHTSFASVFVTPEINQNIEIEINESDIRIDTYRASGAGGQHVNKTDSAVRITHMPSGIVTQSQVDRSQHRNKDIAMNMLKSKLYALKLKEKEANASMGQNKTDIAWGNQIRSYVLQPYQMVKDSRTNTEKGNAEGVLDGDIDEFLESAIAKL